MRKKSRNWFTSSDFILSSQSSLLKMFYFLLNNISWWENSFTWTSRSLLWTKLFCHLFDQTNMFICWNFFFNCHLSSSKSEKCNCTHHSARFAIDIDFALFALFSSGIRHHSFFLHLETPVWIDIKHYIFGEGGNKACISETP